MSRDTILPLSRPPAPDRELTGETSPWLEGDLRDPDFLPEGDFFKVGRAAGPPKVERAGDVIVITLADGRRDAGDMLARELDGATLGLRGCHLLLDLSKVQLLNGRELSTLVRLHKEQAASGGLLTLFNVNPWAYEVLALTRLNTLLRICREALPPS